MDYQTRTINGISMDVVSLNTAIVGSGAAGLNAADRLFTLGQKDIAIVTEGLNKGTSRNTGSDKQTYYKLTLAGKEPDSVYDMARTLYQGGSMDGDLALVEAALSVRAFYHLVEIGVPFPHNEFGEYVGYKTDHDPRQRATSAGPLTSKYMTEKLEEQVNKKGIEVFDGYQVISILKDENRAIGLLTLNLKCPQKKDKRYLLINCQNIIYATGGPAGLYKTSVYPVSQTGATGTALEAGVKGKNLTESQYGLAATKFRWNLSGTYQQVLPRYVSTDRAGGNQKEFLMDYFDDPGQMLDAVFLKGYQWPFDPRKVDNKGSSLIDILVYNEMVNKDRRIWLDYTANPSAATSNGKLDFSLLGEESYQYLKSSDALFGTPLERLECMNQPAIELFKEKGIDLSREFLEVAVCAQHNNGGLSGNLWWESNIKHFFPVGEVNGSHGVYRPGGSALNSGQTGSIRAADYIARNYQSAPPPIKDFLGKCCQQIAEKLSLTQSLLYNEGSSQFAVERVKSRLEKRMSRHGAHIRSWEGARKAARETKNELQRLKEKGGPISAEKLGAAFKTYDLLIAQYVYLSAICDYIKKGGTSRGSYLICDRDGKLPADNLPEKLRYLPGTKEKVPGKEKIQEVTYVAETKTCSFNWRRRRQLSQPRSWFEKVWEQYRREYSET